MKKGNSRILVVLLSVFLLLVGMYVYHVNSLKEGAWTVGNNTYTSRRGIPISRDKINEELNKLSDLGGALHIPEKFDMNLFYRDRLSGLSKWAERLSMPEIKEEIQKLQIKAGEQNQSADRNKLNLSDITDIVKEMQNILKKRDTDFHENSELLAKLNKFYGLNSTNFEKEMRGLDSLFRELKSTGHTFDSVWETLETNVFSEPLPNEADLKIKWEQKWKEYPEPPEWGVTGTTTTTTPSGPKPFERVEVPPLAEYV